MTDLPFALALSQDRISNLIKPKEDSLGDVGTAALRAYGGGGRQGTGFGDQLKGIQRGNLERQGQELKGEMLNYEMVWKQVEQKAQRGDRKATQAVALLKAAGLDDVEPAERPRVLESFDKLTETGMDPFQASMKAMAGAKFMEKQPELTDVYDEQGRKTRGYMKDGKVVQVGGSEAPKPEKEPTPSGLSRLIAERDALPPGHPNRALYDTAIAKETTRGDGWEIETSPTGGTTIRMGGKSGLSGTRADTLRGDLDLTNAARDTVRSLKETIAKNPNLFGAPGSFIKFVQTAKEIGKDVAQGTLGKFLPSFMKSFQADVQSGKVDPVVANFFSEIPQTDVEAHAIAYTVARMRKGFDRVNREDLEMAMDDLQLRGVTSTADVLARLDVIEKEFDRASMGLQGRLGKPAAPAAKQPTPDDPLGIL